MGIFDEATSAVSGFASNLQNPVKTQADLLWSNTMTAPIKAIMDLLQPQKPKLQDPSQDRPITQGQAAMDQLGQTLKSEQRMARYNNVFLGSQGSLGPDMPTTTSRVLLGN